MSARSTSRGRRGAPLATACLVLAALHAGLVAAPRLLAAQPPTAHRRPAASALGARVEQLKRQLRGAEADAAASALEEIWKPQGSLTQSQLEGTWRLEGSGKRAATPDWPRLLLNMYSGGLGRLLDMEMASQPEVTISASGDATTRTKLRWGFNKDEVLLTSKLKVIGTASLRETPGSIRSSALSLTLPLARPARDLRVAYSDGGLLVLRDQFGAMDLLWRQGAGPAVPVAVREELVDQQPPVDREGAEPAAADTATEPEEAEEQQELLALNEKVEALLGRIDSLKGTVQEQRERAAEDSAERRRLLAEADELEKQFEAAAVDVGAQSVKLGAISTLSSRAQDALEDQSRKIEDKAARCDALRAELAGRYARDVALEENVSSLRARETSLAEQIPMLKRDLNVGPRDSWPWYREALKTAQSEFKQVRADLSSSMAELARNKRNVARASEALRKEEAALEAATNIRVQMKGQLEEQQREYLDQESALPLAEATTDSLRERLGDLGAQLEELEAREAESLQKASEAEAEIASLAAEVKETRKAARRAAKGSKKRQSRWLRLR